MKIRMYGPVGIAVGILTVLFFLASICGAAESASQYRSIYPSGGYKELYAPAKVATEASYQGSVPNFWLLRFYIPPVAQGQSSLALFCSQKATIGVVARLGAPPQCDVSAYSTSTANDSFYLGLPWDMKAGTLQQLRERDYRVRNGSGTVAVLTDYDSSSTGEWLYVKILFNGTTPVTSGVSFGVQVDQSAYQEWYNGVNWDSSGNPPLDVNSSVAMGSCDFTSTGAPSDGSSYTITVTKSGTGYVEPPGPVTVQAGQNKVFSFISDPLLRLPLTARVSAGPANGTMKDEGVKTSYTFYNITQNMRLSVVFDGSGDPPPAAGDYTISVYKDGAGTVSPPGPVSIAAGGSQAFTFTPASGWEVDLVTYGVANQSRTSIDGPVSSHTFSNVQDNMELGVVFKQITGSTSYTILVGKEGSGTVSPAGPVTVTAGGSQTFTFVPASGYEVDYLIYRDAGGTPYYEYGPLLSYTFSDVQNNKELYAVFSESKASDPYEADETFPIYNIPVQAGQILNYKPQLNFANPPADAVDYFAGYVFEGKLFMARKELNGNIVFDLYRSDTGLLKSGTYNFQGGTLWECDFFEKAQFQTDLITAPDVDCVVLGVGVKGDLSTLQGVIFKFVAQ